MDFATPLPTLTVATLAFPVPHVLLVTIARERAMNSIPTVGHREGAVLWSWFDAEPSLRVAILTGKGTKAFSAGADLIEQREKRALSETSRSAPIAMADGGFFGISRRTGKKPVIAAVNGYALGGGFEMVLNCDLVIASPTATFGLPEAKRGLFAAAGGLSRAARTFGMQLASEIALAGRVLKAHELERLGFLRVAASPETLLDEALGMAAEIGSMSPDAVIVTRAGLREVWETASVEEAARITEQTWGKKLFEGENLRIGLEAFARKEKPAWKPSKL